MGKVLKAKYQCVHILQLEKTMKLYREILGFELVGAEVLKGKGCEGMLVLHMKAGEAVVYLSLTAPKHMDTIGPIGNVNHNHMMFKVDEVEEIAKQLVEEGYELEHPNYAGLPFNFFTGPNGEIIGLCTY